MNKTTIEIQEDGGKVKILMSKEAQQGSRPDQVAARNLVQIAQRMMQPETMNQFKQFQSQIKQFGM